MGLDIGGFQERPDWPKMGPSLLIATCLILAVRTAKWPVKNDQHFSNRELDEEIEFAATTARRVMVHLMAACETDFPAAQGAVVPGKRRGCAEVECAYVRTVWQACGQAADRRVDADPQHQRVR